MSCFAVKFTWILQGMYFDVYYFKSTSICVSDVMYSNIDIIQLDSIYTEHISQGKGLSNIFWWLPAKTIILLVLLFYVKSFGLSVKPLLPPLMSLKTTTFNYLLNDYMQSDLLFFVQVASNPIGRIIVRRRRNIVLTILIV